MVTRRSLARSRSCRTSCVVSSVIEPADQRGMGDDAVQRALQLADIGDDLVGQELQHLGGHLRLHLLGLGLQDAQAQLIGRGMDVGHQPPAEARAHALLEPLEVVGRFVGGDHHLPVLVDQRVEGVEEFLLGRILAADELHVIDHQHVDRAELLLEGHDVLLPQRADELVHELLGREIDHPALRRALLDMPGDGMHQMGLAEPDPAIEEQRVEGHGARLGDALRCGMGELVRLADDEILEGEARIERRAHILRGEGGGRVGASRFRASVRPLGPPSAPTAAGTRSAAEVLGLHRLGPAAVDHEFDAADSGIGGLPEGADALGIMLGDPVAHEAGLDGDGDLAVALAQQGQGLQPAAESRLAEFAAQPSADLGPLAREDGIDPGSPGNLLDMATILSPGPRAVPRPSSRLSFRDGARDRGCPRIPRPRCSSADSPPRSMQRPRPGCARRCGR